MRKPLTLIEPSRLPGIGCRRPARGTHHLDPASAREQDRRHSGGAFGLGVQDAGGRERGRRCHQSYDQDGPPELSLRSFILRERLGASRLPSAPLRRFAVLTRPTRSLADWPLPERQIRRQIPEPVSAKAPGKHTRCWSVEARLQKSQKTLSFRTAGTSRRRARNTLLPLTGVPAGPTIRPETGRTVSGGQPRPSACESGGTGYSTPEGSAGVRNVVQSSSAASRRSPSLVFAWPGWTLPGLCCQGVRAHRRVGRSL